MKAKMYTALAVLPAAMLLTGCSSLRSAMHTTNQPPPPPSQVSPAMTYPSPSKPVSSPSSSATRHPAPAKCYPTRVVISSLGINESIIPYGLSVDEDGQKVLEPPAQQTVWYDKSVLPGQKGISLIVGHVTYYGPSVFYKLGNIKKGANIRLNCNDGSSLRLTATTTASVDKGKLMTDQRVWGSSSTPVVAFVTCDIHSPMIKGHHTNNFVVWARVK